MLSSTRALPVLLLSLVALLAWGVVTLLGGRSERTGVVARPADGPALEDVPSAAEEGLRAGLDSADARDQEAEATPSTVIWPLVLELECLESARNPELADGQRLGAGGGAHFEGRIADANGEGVEAVVRFIAGRNHGRSLHCDSSGRFGANDLQPGLGVVDVSGPGIIGSRREVRLRDGAETLLNIGYGRLASMYGDVKGPQGDPIEGACVRVDGQEAFTGVEGSFYIPAIASGLVMLEIEAEGFASHTRKLAVTAGRTYMPGKLEWRLQEPSSLSITIPESIGARGAAQAFIIPSDATLERDFPFYALNPVPLQPGSTQLIEGLPAELLTVQVFHAGATAAPKKRLVNLRAGRTTSIDIHLEPASALRGRVMRDGLPVRGASVQLEAANRTQATLAYFIETRWFLEQEVLPPAPPALQVATTDSEGRFLFSSWGEYASARWLEARGPQGVGWAGRAILAGQDVDQEIILELRPRPQGEGRLVLHLPRRFQGLSVEVFVDEAPRDPFVLPDWESLEVEGLDPGTWRVRARWDREEVLPATVLELTPEAELTLELPLKALQGHGPDEWRRAGRVYPR